MIMFLPKGNGKNLLRNPNIPKWVKYLLGCIPSVLMIVLGVWSIFNSDTWQLKALGGLLVVVFLLFAIYVCLKLSVDDKNTNDSKDT